MLKINNFIILQQINNWKLLKRHIPWKCKFIPMVKNEPLGKEAIMMRQGKLKFRGEPSIQETCQNDILLPIPSLNKAKDSTCDHALEMFIQGLQRLIPKGMAIFLGVYSRSTWIQVMSWNRIQFQNKERLIKILNK